jgi:uncharacterized membrane protein
MRLRRYLVAGLLVWLPVGVTILVFKVLLDLMDRVLVLIPEAYRPEELLGFRIPGLGAVLALAVLFTTGVLVANLLGRQLVLWYEALLARIPFVRSIYGGVKNFAAVLLDDRGRSFKKVVLIEYPRKGIYRVGLQTSDTVAEIAAVTGEDIMTVFVPTTPNATTGFLAFVPRDEVVELTMSVEDALKMIVSLGIVVPEWQAELRPGALARPDASP